MDLNRVEKDIEETSQEEGSLEDVDMSFPDNQCLSIAINERLQHVIAYQRIILRLDAAKASVAANKGVGNKQGEDKFQKEVDELTSSGAHCKRNVKLIDKRFPEAKRKMLEIAERIKE